MCEKHDVIIYPCLSNTYKDKALSLNGYTANLYMLVFINWDKHK